VKAKKMETEKTDGKSPWIKRVPPQLAAPSLGDNTADVDRLVKGLKQS
jgi:hypothetical protein